MLTRMRIAILNYVGDSKVTLEKQHGGRMVGKQETTGELFVIIDSVTGQGSQGAR